MKGYNLWSYAPYKPLLRDIGDIYICRIVPSENTIHFEWLDIGADEYSVLYRKRSDVDFILYKKTSRTELDIENLDTDSDYEFYVCSGEKKSLVRLARTGKTVGTVVNYLHPDDNAYSFSGKYLCSPSLVRHPDGFLIASMDLYAFGYPQNLTLIFRSDDNGKSWHYVSELMPCFWGKMFIHNNELYMLACSTEYGDLLIGKSTDGGKSFSAPTVLLRGSNGKCANNGIHKNPQNVIIHNGRIYETLEWGNGSNPEYYHAAMIMSCSVDDDLLVPENWSFSEPVKYDPSWHGTANGKTYGTIEGTLCIDPKGELYSIMRYNIISGNPPYGLVLAYKVNTTDHDAPLEYSHSIKMPCNHSKFMIKYDEKSRKYFSIVTRIDCEQRIHRRNLLSLMSSDDLENWKLICDLIDGREDDIERVGFQYVDFEIEGNDIIFLCRTALNNAHSFHDSNYSTFHRIENFRTL